MISYEIKTIPHNQHRYETCGDYYQVKDKTIIHVSEMDNWRYEFLIAIHEMIEEALIRHHGVSEEAVREFDINYEAVRQEGNDDEPGDDRAAPYWIEHQVATGIERIVAAHLNVDWNEYDRMVLSL